MTARDGQGLGQRDGGIGDGHEHQVALVLTSIALFALAGLCEVGGGYLMWKWWRDGAAWPVGLAGAIVLVLYGIVPTYQASHFGRVHTAYGGVFIVLSLAWGWLVDGSRPDTFDLLGALICGVGVAVIMYTPR